MMVVRLILRWRSKRLTEACVSYEQVLATLLQKVADVEVRDQAKAQWRLLRDNSNEVWDQIETLIEAKAEEKVGDKQDLVVNGAIKPLVDSGETAKAEIVVEMLAKDKLEFCAIKDESEERRKAEVVVKESATEVEVEDKSCTAKAEVVVEMLVKDQVEEFRANKVELEERLLAKVGVEEPRVNKDEMKFCAVKDKLEFFAIKYELEERRRAEVVVEEYANKEVFLRSGNLDPGEVAAEVEEPRATKYELGFCAAKDAEFELLRFVTTGCRAQDNNSEYG